MMAKINLRDFYPWYPHDEFVEVPDEIAEAMAEHKRHEESGDRRDRRHKAWYSLDADTGMEAYAAFTAKSPHEVLEFKEMFCNLCRALNALPEIQGRRVEAHFLIGMSRKEIALLEGTSEIAVRKTIMKGLISMKKFLKNID